jgi:hypothetical protein
VKTKAMMLALLAAWRPAVAADALPDFSDDAFLVGHWQCDAERPGRLPAREEATYTWAFDGRWLALTYTLTPGEPDSTPVKTLAYETFDPTLRKWVYMSVASNGAYGTSYSDGWQGHKKVYGPNQTGEQPWILIANHVSDTEFTEEIRIRKSDEWSRTFFLRCRKSP